MNKKVEASLKNEKIVSKLQSKLGEVEREHGEVTRSTIATYTQENFWQELEEPYLPAVKVARQVFSLDEFKYIMWKVYCGNM